MRELKDPIRVSGIACDPAYGGQGMPHMVNLLFEEMLNGASLSFGLSIVRVAIMPGIAQANELNKGINALP